MNVFMRISARLSCIVSLPVLVACGGSGGGAKSAGDVNCPEGQTFDGEYCQVDQAVATREQSVPPADEPEPEVQPAPNDTPALEEPKPSGEDSEESELGEVEEEETEGTPDEPAPSRATPVDVTMAAQAAPLIQYMASSHLPAGAAPMGAPFAGQFAENQVLERKVQLTAGKCYTIVAAALPPVTEINVELFEEGARQPVAKDGMSGLQAVLGSKDKCFAPEKSGAFRLVLSVEKGRGIAAAQAFQK